MPKTRASLASESEAAKPAYDVYHKALAEARRDVIARWGHGIIFDIHGQVFDADAILRGTKGAILVRIEAAKKFANS
ncbi:MAG: hypothetical protein ACI9NQ_001809 [Paracoccaceae bacterium]